MSKIEQKLLFFAFLVNFCAFATSSPSLSAIHLASNETISCNFERTINITDGEQQVDNSWLHNGLRYGIGLYAKFNYIIEDGIKVSVPEHIRGCICLLKPCIMACCEFPKTIYNHTATCVDKAFDQLWWDVGMPGEQLVKTEVSEKFQWIHSRPTCESRHFLSPEEYNDTDTWYLAANGSVYLPDEEKFFEYDKHCVAVDEKNQKLLVLRCYEEQPTDKRYYMLGIGMVMSVPFLLATFIVYAVIPELRNVHGLSLMSYVGSLAVGYAFLAAVQLVGSRPECTNGATQCYDTYFCTSAAYIIYLSFMLGFFWLNTMCFDIFWTFRGVRGNTSAKKNFMYYCIYAWGMALFFTILAFSIDVSGINDDYKPGMYFSQQQCFLQKKVLVEFMYLYSIILVLICMNITFFGVTAYRIRKVQSETAAVVDADSSRRHSRSQYDNYRFMLYLRLFIIMGVTWSMEFISWAVSPDSPWFYVTDLLNCLQGILIFLLVVCNDKVRKLVVKRYYKFRGITPPETGTTFSDTRNSRLSSSYNRHNSVQLEQRNTLLGNKDKEIKDNNSNNYIDDKKHLH